VISVEATGPLALLQDLGRPGCAHLGVSPSGAADRSALRLANRLVGNDEGQTAIEATFGGLVVTADGLVWVAVTGAPTQVLVNGVPTSSHTTITLRRGDRLAIEPPAEGVRSYLAVRGGIQAPQVLGSASRDVLSGLGPAPLRSGQQLTIGRPLRDLPDADSAPARHPRKTLTLTPGPRLDWFEPSTWSQLTSSSWTVLSACDRVAVRIQGPALRRIRSEELPSEGLVRGAVQVPASGQPLIFLSDHPVTGGYPVVAVLSEQACDHAAQLRPGDAVRFETRHRTS
jgi:biotin-dependent carboxylase-like uncharacterized protein